MDMETYAHKLLHIYVSHATNLSNTRAILSPILFLFKIKVTITSVDFLIDVRLTQNLKRYLEVQHEVFDV